jgi:hypothetical protein
MHALRQGKLRAALFAAAIVCAPLVASVYQATPAGAAALTNVSWSASNNQVSATNVTYAYSFKTATTGVIATITFVVSGSGLGGTPAIATNFGIGAGSVARSGQTITYTVTSPAAVSSGIPIYIELSGLTNSSTAASYTTAITTQTALVVTIDTATSPAITLAASNTAVTVTVAKSLTFTIDTTAFELDLDPSLPALADQTQAVGLTVQTNANSGYTLTVHDDAAGLQSASTGTPTIADVSSGKATSLTWPGAPRFGYTVTGTGATIDSAFTGSKYSGYVSSGEQIASRTNATGGTADTISITNRVAIDYTVPAVVYTDTITYTVTPNYT